MPPDEALPDLVYSMRRIADVLEQHIHEQRGQFRDLGADVDEVPVAVRIDLEKLAGTILGAIAKATDQRPGLELWKRIADRVRASLWAERGDDETDARLAVRRLVDHLRSAVAAELGDPWVADPDALVAALGRREGAPGSVVVGEGSGRIVLPKKYLIAAAKIAAAAIPAGFVVHLLHLLHILPH